MAESADQPLLLDLPRERLQRLGPDALSDAELMAVLLRTGTRGKPVLQMSMELLEAFKGSLLSLSMASVKELCCVPGMGETKALELCAAFALARRLAKQRMSPQPYANNPELVVDFMRGLFRGTVKEEFHILLLDKRLRVIRNEMITTGLVDRSLVHAREVFRSAIREACSAIIICHNHPSGDPAPSPEDIAVTKMLVKSGDIIGIRIIDHIIISGLPRSDRADYFSFREAGLFKIAEE